MREDSNKGLKLGKLNKLGKLVKYFCKYTIVL